jgi:hypothetical protein
MLIIVLLSLAAQASSSPSLRGSIEESMPSRSLRGPLVDLIDDIAPIIDPISTGTDIAPIIDLIGTGTDTIVSKIPDNRKHPEKNETLSTSQPSQQPSFQPSHQLSMIQPSSQKRPKKNELLATTQPSQQPSFQPSQQLSMMHPTYQPFRQPSNQPSSMPTTQPSQDLSLVAIKIPQKNSVDKKGDTKPNTVDQVTDHGGDVMSGIFTVHCIWYGDWSHDDRKVTLYFHYNHLFLQIFI